MIGNTGLGEHSSVETSLPGAIVTQASDWYDFEAKYAEGGMELVVPAPIGERGDRPRPRARRAGLRGDRRHRPRPLRLLRPRRRRGARQRDQHDPRLHRDERLRQAVRGRAASPYPELCDRLVRARGRAPRARARATGSRAWSRPRVAQAALSATSLTSTRPPSSRLGELGEPDQVVLRAGSGTVQRRISSVLGRRR